MIYWSGFLLYVLAAFVFMGAVLFAQDYLKYARWAVARHGAGAVLGIAILLTLTLAIGRQVFPVGSAGDDAQLESLFFGIMAPLSLILSLDVRRFRKTAAGNRVGR